MHPEIGPLTLQVVFEVEEHPPYRSARGMDEKVLLSHSHDDAVIEQDTVFVGEHGITCTAYLEARDVIDVQAVDEGRGVWPLYFDLAERRAVEHAYASPYSVHLPQCRSMDVFIAARVEIRTTPAIIAKHRLVLHVPLVSWQVLPRSVLLARRGPGKGANGDWLIRWPELGGTNLRDRLASQLGDDGQDVEVAGLALVDAHAASGVALNVLDRYEVFTDGQLDIRHLHVVLEIEPLLVGGARLGKPERLNA
ncbi:hypothetical protein D9M70_480460 [compost metagenome]